MKTSLKTLDVQALIEQVLPRHGLRPANARLRRRLQEIDRSCEFTADALRIFQGLLAQLAVPTHRPLIIPLCEVPFWQRSPGPLTNYRSQEELPSVVDVVIIGAGLTGSAAAYRLKDSGLRVVVLDQGDPAGEASGRNGGNFELLPENSVGTYEGLAPGRLAFMKRRYPHVPEEVLQAVSERQASLVLGLALRNRDLLKETILNENIVCDFSPRGWLHIATSEKEEQGLCDEVSLAAQHGQRIEIWSRNKIRQEFGIETDYLGRFIPGDGTYHPYKYVCGELTSALRSGVELFTRTRVEQIVPAPRSKHRVFTDRGVTVATNVIIATNAFTRDLLPEMSAIEPYQSQIMVTEHVPDRARGRIVTSDNGPIFFNQPKESASNGRAPLLMGGGDDRKMRNPLSRRRSAKIHARLLELRDALYPELAGQPPSTEWIGAMAFTPDGLPCIGFLREGMIVAAGYNGYGGSYTTAAGHAAAEMALTGQTPDWVPEEIFSPRRLLHDDPLFLTETTGLWRIAASLCDQLQAVNRRISDALILHQVAPLSPAKPHSLISRPEGRNKPIENIDSEALRSYSSFKKFTMSEVRKLIACMRRWDLPRGTTVFSEGSLGQSCFVILEGSVDVSIESRGQQQLLATLQAGSVFGQMSLIASVPRSATCTAQTDLVLLEIDKDECEQLLRSRSPVAIKLLATLNEGLISALRGADRRLMQIEFVANHDGDRNYAKERSAASGLS